MLLGAGILFAGVLCCPIPAVTVRPVGGSLPVLAAPAAEGTELRVAWVHTVSNRPVWETFSIDATNRLCLKKMVFDHAGPGLPAHPEEGTMWTYSEGAITVTGYDRCLDRLRIAVSPVAHRLEVGNTRWDLIEAFGEDRLILISVEKIPLLLLLPAKVR